MMAVRATHRLGAALVAAGLLATAWTLDAQTAARGQAAATPPRAPVALAAPTAPRLVVMLVIDQFRADYAQTYGSRWTRGLRRLFSDGAVFPLAEYPYGGAVTCPGHFSIGTGSLPWVHGMISNTWYDPQANRTVACVTDPAATSVPFGGGTGRERHSPRNLLVPTYVDELRLQATHPPQIVSVALKPRSAIGLAGHAGPGTMVVWEEDDGTWATSDAFTKAPWPEVDEYVRAHPIAAAYGQAWTRLRPESTYLFEDDAPGEASPAPWGRTFPHALESKSGKPDNAFVTAWERSPWNDAYVADLAMALAGKRRLGQHANSTDVLAVSFSSLDFVGHQYGPRSHEVQDVMARLDVLIGKLFDSLDQRVGAGRYVVSLSSDHGVATLPEQAAASGLDAGRIVAADIRTTVQTTIATFLGEGMFYGALAEQNVHLRAGVLDQLRAKPGAIDAVKNAIAAVKGVWRVYGPGDLAGAAPTADPFLRAWRLSYLPGRSGDFVIVPKPYWIVDATGTTHGTPFSYDTRVPVVLMGAGIKPGRYLTPATPLDIAPTLAWLTGVTLSHTDGHVLVDALVRRP
jgi:predicted AlkP superfamily pyrophosphatase or phosphodiesterase